jgi:hypothetical protein
MGLDSNVSWSGRQRRNKRLESDQEADGPASPGVSQRTSPDTAAGSMQFPHRTKCWGRFPPASNERRLLPGERRQRHASVRQAQIARCAVAAMWHYRNSRAGIAGGAFDRSWCRGQLHAKAWLDTEWSRTKHTVGLRGAWGTHTLESGESLCPYQTHTGPRGYDRKECRYVQDVVCRFAYDQCLPHGGKHR